MIYPTIEAHKGGIIITGDSASQVHDAATDLQKRVGECFFSFTTPVRQADAHYVSTGHVLLKT